jgi:uncharacterized protein (TIGR03084 family)
MDVTEVRADLLAEQEALDRLISTLDSDDFTRATPSPRWTVADQLGHLTYFDGTATMAITDPAAFRAHVDEIVGALTDEPGAADDATLGEYRAMDAAELVAAWRANRAALADASATLGEDDRVEWYGPSMGAKSFLTARLMEVWAHGRDIADTVGIEPEPTDRLRHIAQLGFITRNWSYLNRGLEPPPAPVRVELTAPSGTTWTFGPDDATELVRGPAADFCLVVTQRRNVDDTELEVVGDAARDWMDKAQAFAGGPTDGPPARAGAPS